MLYGLSRMEFDLRGLPTAIVFGLVASWLRGRSGSIVPAALASIAVNAVPLVPLMLGKGELTLGGRYVVGSVIAAGACAWVLALVFARDGRVEHNRLLDS